MEETARGISSVTATTITVEELRQRCDWVGRRNLRILRETGSISPDFYFGKGEGSLLYRLVLNKLGFLMNSGRVQELLFALTRRLIEDAGYDCFIFASEMWMFKGNERYIKLTDKQRQELTDRAFEKAVRLGYGEVFEVLGITGQTPDISHQVQIPFRRNNKKVVQLGDPESYPMTMAGGRSKMWGDWNEPGMAEAYESVGKFTQEFKKKGLDLPNVAVLVNIATEAP